MIRDVYRPYHPWRHGYKRERFRKWFMRFLKAVLVAEGIVLAGRYIKEHTFMNVYERKIEKELDVGMQSASDSDEVFGIGVDAADGEVFWFHRYMENVE